MSSEKKRKRQEQGDGRPAKKAAVAPAEGNVTVEYIKNEEGRGPLIASTPGLKFPSHITFKAYERHIVLPGSNSTELLLQSSDHTRLDYSAREEKDGSSESKLRDYIGIYDPATGKMQLMPVKRLTVRSSLRKEREELQEEEEKKEEETKTFTERRHKLAEEFGSKRSKKAINSMSQNAIKQGDAAKDEAIANNVLEGMAGATEAMPTSEQLAAAVDEHKPRPRANLDAEYPVEVYTVDVVVGKDLMAMIEVSDWVSASEAGEGVNVSSRFVARRITTLVKNKQYQKLKLLRFILLCIKFNDVAKSGKGAKRIPQKGKFEQAMGEDVPEALGNTIRRRFASENNDLPRWNIDNLITHACAAALIVDDFEVDVNDLKEDFKLDNKMIKQYFSELGCRLAPPSETDRTKLKITKAESSSHTIAKLKLPLKFPTLRRGPPKRR